MKMEIQTFILHGSTNDSSTNKIYIGTGRESKKAINLKNLDIVYFCIDEPNQTYKGVRGTYSQTKFS